MKKYYNKEKNEWYYEGTIITRKVEHGIFSGYPTEEHLKAWGFEEYVEPVEEVMKNIDNEDTVQNSEIEE